MSLTTLNAISPIDGRYRKNTKSLSAFFSEEALIKYRILVEVEYFIALCDSDLPQLKNVNRNSYEALRNVYLNFTTEDALVIKETEKTTNHDVKAVEYFLRQKLEKKGMKKVAGMLHFGLTSQDVNNTALALMLKEAVQQVYLPNLSKVQKNG
jgi:adenylosuccinate lyase